jgi:hypothetical protein
METTQTQPTEKVGTSDAQTPGAWLQRLVGDWTIEGETAAGPVHPASTFAGTQSVRALGRSWVVAEGKGEMPGCGGEATTLMTLGYDPANGRFVGTWVGSMMSHLWVYDGALDDDGRVLTLDTEGPNCTADGGTARFRDVIEFADDDLRTLSSYMLGPDGEWSRFMTARYRRTSSLQ